MNGMFDLKLFNNRGLKDRAFEKAIQDGYIMDQLDDLPIERHLPKQQNWIFDNFAAMMIQEAFSGPSAATNWYEIAADANGAALGFVALTYQDALPSYTEDYTYYAGYNKNIHSTEKVQYPCNTGSCGKRFYEDQITAATIWSDTAREAVHFRNRWLWTPSQGNANNIKSVAIHAHEDADATSAYACAGRIGRVRLRDSAGLTTTLVKSSSNSLLVEYTFTLVSF